MRFIDVKRLTTVVIDLARDRFDLKRKLDNDMFNHVVFVSNRILLIAKQDGVTKDSLTQMGKYLWRLYNVITAYNHKRRDITLNEILNIVTDFESVFTGG